MVEKIELGKPKVNCAVHLFSKKMKDLILGSFLIFIGEMISAPNNLGIWYSLLPFYAGINTVTAIFQWHLVCLKKEMSP